MTCNHNLYVNLGCSCLIVSSKDDREKKPTHQGLGVCAVEARQFYVDMGGDLNVKAHEALSDMLVLEARVVMWAHTAHATKTHHEREERTVVNTA